MTRALPVLAAMVFVLSTLVGCDVKRIESDQQVAAGVELLRAGRHAQALERFQEATALDDTNPAAWYYTGYTRLRTMNNANGAIDPLIQAVELDESDAEAAYQLGYAYELEQRLDDAENAYSEAVRRDDGHAGALFRLAGVRETRANYRGAIDAYTRCIYADPFFALCWAQLGNLYAEFGASEAAVQVLRNGLENNPQTPELQAALGTALYESGQPGRAIEVLEEAVAAGQSSTAIRMTLGLAYLGRYEDGGMSADRNAALEHLRAAAAGCSPSSDGSRCGAISMRLRALEESER